MLFRETDAVCCENHKEHIKTLCGQNVEFFDVITNGKSNYHCSIKELKRRSYRQDQDKQFLKTAVFQPNSCEVEGLKACRNAGRDWCQDQTSVELVSIRGFNHYDIQR
jgi:hypothetical protein